MPERVTDLEFLLDDRNRKNKFRRGLWRARVVNDQDTENRGRLQVRILLLHPESQPRNVPAERPKDFTQPINRAQDPSPSTRSELVDVTDPDQIANTAGRIPLGIEGVPLDGVPNDLCPWAEPAFPFGGGVNRGFFALPTIGDTVWVGFELGFTGAPVWLGAWYGENELPPEITNPANVRLIKTPGGHLILMDDTEGARILVVQTSPTQQFILDEQAGKITLKQGAATIEMDGTKVDITTSGDINIGGVAATLGVVHDAFLTLFNGHVHSGVTTGGGSSGPPTVPAVVGTHSSATVKTKP